LKNHLSHFRDKGKQCQITFSDVIIKTGKIIYRCDILSPMAKKTKKEKIIADLRRKMRSEGSFATLNSSSPILNFKLPELNSQKKKEITNTSDPVQSESLYIYPIHLVKKDLTKTLLLCILAISFELALFFILEKHLITLPF